MYGMETAFFRFASNSDDPKKVFGTAMGSLLATTVFFTICLLALSQPIANYLQYPDNAEYVRWFALIIAFDTLVNIPFAQLRLQAKPSTYAGLKLINVLTNVGLNIFFLWPLYNKDPALFSSVGYIYDPSIGVGYVFIANLVASTLTLLLFIPNILKNKIDLSIDLLKKMLSYSWPLIIIGLAGMVNETLDRILLKHLLPGTLNERLSEIGIYSAVYKLSIFMTLMVQAFRLGVEPFFFSEAKTKDAKRTYSLIMLLFVIIGGAIFIGVNGYMNILKFIIGENYWEGLSVVPILLIANLFLGIIYNLSVWYKITDRTQFAIGIALFGAAITICLNWLLIPTLGYTGSAYATLAAYMSMAVLSYILSQRYYTVPYPLRKIGFYLLLMMSLFILHRWVALLLPDTIAIQSFTGTIPVAVYAAIVWFFERDTFRKVLAKT